MSKPTPSNNEQINPGTLLTTSSRQNSGLERLVEIRSEGTVARITLNRPDRHNALMGEMINELTRALDDLSNSDDMHFVVLSGNGRSFCAGADLNWFSGAEKQTEAQNPAQTQALANIFLKIFQLPQITIAAVNGNIFGGGIGLMAACDFVFAETTSRFMFSEVKRGLIPATILPFVAKRLSVQHLRKWILTAEMFYATEAYQAGLIDYIVDNGKLEPGLNEFIHSFECSSPDAVKSAKQLINKVISGVIDVTDTSITSEILAKTLLSADGQEGIQAYLEKRKPVWQWQK